MAGNRQQTQGVREATPREINVVLQRLWADMARLQGEIAAVGRQVSSSSASGLATSVAQLQSQMQQLQQQLSALQNTIDQSQVSVRLDADTGNAVPVYPTGTDTVSPVDPSDPMTINAVLGLTEMAGGAGEIVPVRRYGPMSVPGMSLEPGRSVYASTAGGITQDPSYAAYAVPLGVAVSESAIFVRPELPLLQREDLYASPFDDVMPVTWGMVRNRLGPLLDLLDQPDGFLVKAGDQVVTRVLIASSGGGIVIENSDGFDGDPIFSAG